MKFKWVFLLILFSLSLGLLSLIFAPRALAVSCVECVQSWQEEWRTHCISECWPDCASDGWTSTSMSNCSGLSRNDTCCRSSGGCSSSCGGIPQWGYCYASGCEKTRDPAQEGACFFRYKYSYTNCSAGDTCEGGTGLLAGLCTDNGCGLGGLYKTCCDGNGNVENCQGSFHSGSCPHEEVMCGYGGNPSCGQAACLSGVPVPTSLPGVPTPTPPPPSSCGGDCGWYQDEHNGCSWCTDRDRCMSSGMCSKSWSANMNTAPPGEPPNGYCSYAPDKMQGRCCGCEGNPPACTPNCGCASNTCIGSHCPNGCGGQCDGLKCCVANPSQPTCSSPSLGNPVYNSTVNLVWTAPSSWGHGCPDSKLYRVYLGPAGAPTELTDVPYTQTSYTQNNLADGDYSWKVEAVNNAQKTMSGVCNFRVKTNFDPWWQVQDGDAQARGSLTSMVSELATDPYLLLLGPGGSPGVVTYGTSLNLNNRSVSQDPYNWQAKSAYAGTKVGFDYLANRLNLDKSKIFSGDLAATGDGIYYLNPGGTFNFNGGDVGSKKIVVFVDGNVLVGADTLITNAAAGGFFALIVKGDLTFDGPVTKAQGFYLADGALTVSEDGESNQQFEGKGSFIGWTSVTLQRDLGATTGNRTTPAQLFVGWPQLYLNAPKEFLFTPSVFQEVAP